MGISDAVFLLIHLQVTMSELLNNTSMSCVMNIAMHGSCLLQVTLFLGATYKFRVLAVYSNMDNRWSQPSRRVTLVDGDVPRFPPTPSSGPIIVKAEPVGPNTISLKWQVLP